MNNQELKQLAERIIQDGTISPSVAKFIFEKLSTKELKILLSNLKRANQKNVVTITTAEPLNKSFTQELESLFKGKTMTIMTDPKVGAGILVKDNDNIIGFTFENYINHTVNSLKNEL